MFPLQNLAALQATLQAVSTATPTDTAATQSSDIFGGMWHAAAQQIQKTSSKAQEAVTGLLSGQGVEIHDAMIATQQADVTFALALQVRNKAISAYQQMMAMQF